MRGYRICRLAGEVMTGAGWVGLMYETAGDTTSGVLLISVGLVIVGVTVWCECELRLGGPEGLEATEKQAEDATKPEEPDVGFCYYVNADCAEFCRDGCQMKLATKQGADGFGHRQGRADDPDGAGAGA